MARRSQRPKRVPTPRARACLLLGGLLATASASAQGSAQPGVEGVTRSLTLKNAAYVHPGVPNVVVHGRFGRLSNDQRRPLDLVVFLHGFRGCALARVSSEPVRCGPKARRPVPGRGLGRVHDASRTDTLLVVPQLALLRRDGSPGRFGRAGVFRAFLEELLNSALASELGPGAFERVSRIALVAHSAGYQTALAILDRGGASHLVRDVVLLDALYAGPGQFAGWLEADSARRFISLHAGRGKPTRHSRALARRFRRAKLASLEPVGFLAETDHGGRAPRVPQRFRWAITRVDTAHRRFPEVHLPAVLRLLFGERSEPSP